MNKVHGFYLSLMAYTCLFSSSLLAQDAMFIDAEGRVGIGTGTPDQPLVIERDLVEPTVVVRNPGNIGGATFRMQDDASGADFKFKSTGKAGFKIRDQRYGRDVITVNAQTDASGRKAMYIDAAGNVGIGTDTDSALAEALVVVGSIQADNIVTSPESLRWPDYVFNDDYALPTLPEVEAFVEEHHHLPGVPSANEVAANGIAVNEMIALHLEKIEQLTLYLIALEKENALLRSRDQELHRRLEALEQQ